jgi:hypothetical protein
VDIGLELVKRIISSDELCDKVNSTEYKNEYIHQIEDYILSLISDVSNINYNFQYVNRYLRKFVIGKSSSENVFFNPILLKLYELDIRDPLFSEILGIIKFDETKEFLMQKYDQYVIKNCRVSCDELVRMLSFYCYVCSNYVLPSNYIDFFTYNFIDKDISLSYDLLCFFYKSFALSFADSKSLNVNFEVCSQIVRNDPYYDNRRYKVVIYNQDIGEKVDPLVLSDLFFQIKYLYLLKGINDFSNKVYSYEQLCLVKEVCLISILGDDFFDSNYGGISFSNELRSQSRSTVRSYFKKIGLNICVPDFSFIDIDYDVMDDEDKPTSIGILFDIILKRENPNLLKELLKNYPVLGCEYKKYKKKSLLGLLLDIYSNRRLLVSFNRDLEWYSGRVNKGEDLVVLPKIERLNDKISVCTSYINVMSLLIKNGDMILSDIVRSIGDLITYDSSDSIVRNDIFSILNTIIPLKISKLCSGRNMAYRDFMKKKIIKCYMDSMDLVRNNIDVTYFMKLYSCLENSISACDVD